MANQQIKEYEYVITDTLAPLPKDYNSSTTVSNTTWTDTGGYTSIWPYTTTYWYGNTIYMYQIFCPKPRCKGVFWGQVNTTVTCPKCFSTIKLIREPKADYEVPVHG